MSDNKLDKNKDKKKVSVTPHSWDGIEEYNNPAPRWWLIVWLICTIWAIGYWILYPTWPIKGGNTKGILGWTKYSKLEESQKDIEIRKSATLKRFSKSSFKQIQQDPELMEFAMRGGSAIFKNICSACHGSGAAGGKGFPNLNDDDWLWGGKIEEIYQTLLYGIRSGHENARMSQMPSFGVDKLLNKKQIEQVSEYVLSLSGKGEYNKEGEKIFKANCVVCHGKNAKGNHEIGSPNLTDQIWLYGSDRSDLFYTIYFSRYGAMPAWLGRIDRQGIRQVALYVHSLGGGE